MERPNRARRVTPRQALTNTTATPAVPGGGGGGSVGP